MLSVLIETRNDDERLAATLGSLVPGAVEGIVREVIVCDRGSTDQTHRVAEHAGCHYVAAGGLPAGIRQAKGDWLLILEPGARPVEGWIEGVREHVARHTMPARFSRARGERGRLLARVFSGRRRALAEGLVISKAQASALSRTLADAEALARGVSARRLPSEIRLAVPG